MFKEEEISNINIPLNLFRGEDSLVWHFSNLGIYSVKSGYALACNLKLNNRVDSSVNPYMYLMNAIESYEVKFET